ncbi:unnamed protein product (macronuclear) [Paramecium tetraurelia]|uniref:Glycoside hydrolase family 13 N-terminal domain-containing protein n=1 Tax=Paramecium tetraurelia TaxID=5888 RepID=A0BFG5_PARTE|nr:uncharacterized protein GSPATT00028317001 [Paramecium tetraurelia]CAK57282.1 unnamed protein product [Paramecium tetraurelia]|eukprot:XP_001424680.1 hypothetical protein (macronuclear) [Paramecium tetraurelia strain d4-2]
MFQIENYQKRIPYFIRYDHGILQNQQSVLENEEFLLKYQKNVDQLQTVIEEPELKEVIQSRNEKFFQVLEQIIKVESSIKDFAKGYQKFGFVVSDNGITYREWAPNAKELKLNEYSCTTDNGGNWEVFIPKDDDDNHQIVHGSPLITYCNDLQRVSVWSQVKKGEQAIFWNPENKYEFQQQQLQQKQQSKGLKINKQRINQLENIPGYNAILITEQVLMALDINQTNPDDLKKTIDNLHQQGLSVLMEIDHQLIGQLLKNWDGGEFQYVREGTDQLDYSKWEVLRLLLSNISFWITEYQIDGFKFSNIDLTDDIDIAVYLMLANDLIHDILPNGISVINSFEYPALCRTIKEGGLGFDFKVSQSQTKQYLPKTLYEIPLDASHLQQLNGLVLGQGVITNGKDNNLLLLESQLGWLETEFAEVNVIDFVIEVKRSKYIFLFNPTDQNRTIKLSYTINKVINHVGYKWTQIDDNNTEIQIQSEQGLIIE